ncbi:hypothetical protein D3Z94_25245 [Klebsiella pneumoniae]|nr:hypothetical protein D3Z94_25245 [Klebsiella pneumoniae]
MIIIINFLLNRRRNDRGFPLPCATIQRDERFDNLVKFYLPPTQFSREKLLLEKSSVFSNKHFALGFEIEGVPNCLFWVTYEDALFRFGFQLFRLKLFDISITSPNFKKRQLWPFAIPQFVWCRLNGF